MTGGREAAFYKGLFRAPGGWATVHVPTGAGFRRRYDPERQRLTVYRMVPTGWIGVVHLGWVGRISGSRADKDLAHTWFQSHGAELLGEHVSLSSKGPALGFPVEGGHGVGREWVGAERKGRADRSWTAALVSDHYLVSMAVQAMPDRWGEVQEQLVEPVLRSLRLGRSAPRLRGGRARYPLEGVWEGPLDQPMWLIFDPRGYVARGLPRNPVELDLDVRSELGEVGSYELEDDSVLTIHLRGEPPQVGLKLKDKLLNFDGVRVRRADGALDGKFLHGVWEAVDNRGTARLHLQQDGRFRLHDLVKRERRAGFYAIANDRIRLTFDDGEMVAWLIFMHQGLDEDVLWIDGRPFERV